MFIMAAPSLYNDSIAKRICDRISNGDSFTGACVLEGIGEATGRLWKSEHDAFLRAVQEAQERRKSTLIKALYSGIDKDAAIEVTTVRTGENVGYEEYKTTVDHGAKVRYAMWALPRIDPENWSDKAQVEKLAQAKFRESIQYLMSCVDDNCKTQIANALMAAGLEVGATASPSLAETPGPAPEPAR